MSITGFWILLYYALKKSVTLVTSSRVLVEPDQQDKLGAMISCNITKIYRIVNYNKSIATKQISQTGYRISILIYGTFVLHPLKTFTTTV